MHIDSTKIAEFFNILYGEDSVNGDLCIVRVKDKKTKWVNTVDRNGLVDLIAEAAVKDELWFNIFLHDEKNAKEKFSLKNKSLKYARGDESTATVVFAAFLDIDVKGPNHAQSKLPTRDEALEFLHGLPIKVSVIVDSGGGFHGYIIFDEPFQIKNDIQRQRIKRLLKNIQQLVLSAAKQRGWTIDAVGDLARMGRVPGTYNKKNPDNPREVSMVYHNAKHKYSVEELESYFSDQYDFDQTDKSNSKALTELPEIDLIFQNCSWFSHTINDSNNLPEPEWFAQLSISSRCRNGREESHRISSIYKDYSHNETEAKINHALEGGPRTCRSIAELSGDEYCSECSYKDTISSPIQLGYNRLAKKNNKESLETLKEKTQKIINLIKEGDRGAHMLPESLLTFAELALVDQPEYLRQYDQLKDQKVQIQGFKKEVSKQKKELSQKSRYGNGDLRILNDFLKDSPCPDIMIPGEYKVDKAGLFKVFFDEDGAEILRPIARDPVIISKRFRDIDSGKEDLELAWKADGWRKRIVSREIIASKSKITELAADGLPIHSVNANEMVLYFSHLEALNKKIIPYENTTSHLGWQGQEGEKGFLVGDAVYTEGSEDSSDIIFNGTAIGDVQIANAIRKVGSRDKWLDAIVSIHKYPVILATLYASFSSVLLEVLGCSNFIIELACRTSKGKTTSLRIAASVWGCPDERRSSSMIQSWSNTKVYVERVAAILNGLPTILDDSKLCKSPEFLSEILYMVANGRGKGRGNVKGIAFTKPIKTVLISSAETPSVARTTDGGLRGRVLECTMQPFFGVPEFFETNIPELVTKLNRRIVK